MPRPSVCCGVTCPAAPSGPARLVRVEPVSDSQLRVSWQPPGLAQRNGEILLFSTLQTI